MQGVRSTAVCTHSSSYKAGITYGDSADASREREGGEEKRQKGGGGKGTLGAEGKIKECTPPVQLDGCNTVILLAVSFTVGIRLRVSKQTKQCHIHPPPNNMRTKKMSIAVSQKEKELC